MFSHCVHCCQDLGTNESVEHFQVGSKLAFDAEKGRLWVICPHCSRWNLTPLDERWEAVEECERLFRDQRLRAQTTHVGYAKLRDGTGLVRIGRPLRPEFAAWRYGREFSRRRTRTILAVSAVGVATAGVALGGISMGAVLFLPHLATVAFQGLRPFFDTVKQFELPRGPGRAWTVSGDGTMILPDGEEEWMLSIRHHFGRVEYRGTEGRRLLTSVLARLNHAGGGDSLVRDAVREVEARPTSGLLRHIAQSSAPLWAVDGPKQSKFDREDWRDERRRPINRAGLAHLSRVSRLALEMSLHEESERRALDGEMAQLYEAWQEAEEIAGIADNFFLPPGTEEFIEKHRKR